MEDLSGMSWTSSSSSDPKKPPPMNSGHQFPSILSVRRNEPSNRSTPLSASSGHSNPPSKPATPANDSFANLVSFNSSNTDKNLPLVERQKRLQEEKAKQDAANRARFESQYGSQNNQFWDSLEQGGSRPPIARTSTQQAAQPADEDDLLAAFDASAPVDASTHFPVPSPSRSPNVEPTPSQVKSNGAVPAQSGDGMQYMEDDDTFGLNQLKPKQNQTPQAPANDDDDFLGLLGKPVSEFPRPEPQRQPSASASPQREDSRTPHKPANDVDRAVAELVDMGFPADKASQALSATPSGTDTQAAVGYLLDQAHDESRQKARGRQSADTRSQDRMEQNREASARRGRDVPPWMREERPPASRNTSDARSPGGADREQSPFAANFGNNLLRTAGSLWKTGSKRVQQVVNDMNAEHDPNQPRWMRDASAHEEPAPQLPSRNQQRKPQPPAKGEDFTDEALLLEQGAPPPRRAGPSHDAPQPGAGGSAPRAQRAPAEEQRMPQPTFMQKPPSQQWTKSKSPVSRTAVEEQSAQAYVSPARRKRPSPQPPAPEQNVDLFEASAPSTGRSTPAAPSQRPKPTPSTALPTRPKAPPRDIPSIPQEALSSTNRQREKGTEAYKRGDFAVAHEAFTAALSMLPDKHPINIINRSNHAMTSLKIGEPKAAVADADFMLELIGQSKGEGESIDLGNGEPAKPMKDSFGKALMRKAEALEQLERWEDAAKTWRLAVETGYGGGTSIQGRNRCEKAAGISKPAQKPPAPTRRPPAPAPKRPSAVNELAGAGASSANDSAAVNRLRAANEAAERADDEKFALSESVDSRLAAWKNGKQDNLRALLGSLDTVLWPEAGWKKINMSELVLPNKVKVQYMKGISKVHPDKVGLHPTAKRAMTDLIDPYRRYNRATHDRGRGFWYFE